MKKHTSVAIPTDIHDEMRGASEMLNVTQASMAAEGLTLYLEKLRKKYNNGKPFDVPDENEKMKRTEPLL